MVQPSLGTTIAFVAIVGVLAIAFVVGVYAAGGSLNEPRSITLRATRRAALGMLAWLAVTGAVSASGLLEDSSFPPRVMIFFVTCNLVAIALAMSRTGARLADGLPVAALVGVQAFRLPLELVLHRWAEEGVLPIQMTYAGHNFDIVTGVLAIVVGGWLAVRGPSRRLVWGFNLVGFALLVTVATIAVLSAPTPLRRYMEDPPVLLAFHFPYGWIVPVCVAGALFAHIVVFRWLART
jgi:hypothetical protein